MPELPASVRDLLSQRGAGSCVQEMRNKPAPEFHSAWPKQSCVEGMVCLGAVDVRTSVLQPLWLVWAMLGVLGRGGW